MTIPARIIAFLFHFSISCLLALLALLLVFFVWYPAPLHSAVGVTSIFLIVLGVDVTVGPLLTLVVYKQGKKSLRFDLTVIALLQLVAFSYGLFTVAEGRPVWLVFSVDQFELVQAYQVDTRKQSEARAEFSYQPWLGPVWAAALRASTREEKNTILMESLAVGVDIAQRPERFVALSEQQEDIRQHSMPIEALSRFNTQQAVDKVLQRWPEADAYLPMMARAHPVTVLINKASAKVVAIVDLNPWQ